MAQISKKLRFQKIYQTRHSINQNASLDQQINYSMIVNFEV
jgi:hypothetical protein